MQPVQARAAGEPDRRRTRRARGRAVHRVGRRRSQGRDQDRREPRRGRAGDRQDAGRERRGSRALHDAAAHELRLRLRPAGRAGARHDAVPRGRGVAEADRQAAARAEHRLLRRQPGAVRRAGARADDQAAQDQRRALPELAGRRCPRASPRASRSGSASACCPATTARRRARSPSIARARTRRPSGARSRASSCASPAPRAIRLAAGEIGPIWARSKTLSMLAVPKIHLPKRDDGVPIGGVGTDGWFRTGDLGQLDKNGRLTITGREDDLVKVDGKRVALGEVEGCLEAFPKVKAAQARVVTDDLGGPMVVARVVRAGMCRAEDIIDHCARNLAPYKVPRQIEFCESCLTPVLDQLAQLGVDDDLAAAGELDFLKERVVARGGGPRCGGSRRGCGGRRPSSPRPCRPARRRSRRWRRGRCSRRGRRSRWRPACARTKTPQHEDADSANSAAASAMPWTAVCRLRLFMGCSPAGAWTAGAQARAQRESTSPAISHVAQCDHAAGGAREGGRQRRGRGPRPHPDLGPPAPRRGAARLPRRPPRRAGS